MAAEDHNGEHTPRGVLTGVDHSLDSLARGLASGNVSRGKALRLMGAVLVGAALTFVPGVAWAKPKPGKKCKQDTQCPTGQSCIGGTCSVVDICPPSTTCRTCYCQDDTTGIIYSTCNLSEGPCGTAPLCSDVCPPGTTDVGAATGCANPGQAQFCAETATGFGCSERPCLPSGT
jgi:hypothetical protein